MFTSGSDAIASIKFDLAAGQPTTGTGLDGSITWALSGDGLTLTGSIGGTAVITLVLSGQLAAGVGGTASPTVTATLLSEFPHVELPADADTLTISGIKVVATDSDGTGIAAPATISVEVIDDQPSVEISAGRRLGLRRTRRTRLRKTGRICWRDHACRGRGPGCDAGGDAGWLRRSGRAADASRWTAGARSLRR